MARLDQEIVERAESFAHRMVDVAESLAPRAKSARVIDQMIGCGTSVGANTAEADEALSRPDFSKALGWVLRELAESRFWLRFVGKRGWVKEQRLSRLLDECEALRRILGTMVARTKRNDRELKRIAR